MVNVVLVDGSDNEIGQMEKVAAHMNEGTMHRAFTAIVFNSRGETLIAQRSADKMLWPLVWDNTCASHPLPDEDYVIAGERRLSEELGFTCKLILADIFAYSAKYKDIGSENELCATLIGEYNGEINPVADEVADYKWINIPDLKADMAEYPDKYTIWFKIAIDRLADQGKIK